MKDYSSPHDPYGISEMTAQSAHTPDNAKAKVRTDGDVRGNTILAPRSIPTQAEVDALRR